MPFSLFDLQFLILSGKGGVGRTTVAAAIARAGAASGKRVLIAQTDAVERLGKMLGRPGPIGPVVTNLAPGIDAVNMTPKESLHQYALLVLKYEAVYRALFASRAVRGFLSAIPGLDAYAMLGKAWWHTTESSGIAESPPGSRPRPKYDLVILDGPATGHAVAMLKIPKAIIDATPTGPLVKDARALRDLLSDSARSALVIVTRPEDLPASETRELARAARRDLGISLGPVIVNAVPPDRLSHGPAADVLDRFVAPTGARALDATLAIAAGLREQRRTADRIINDLKSDPGQPLVCLPWVPATELTAREIDQLAAALRSAL
ncbi:MAG: ArsA family ATPase [Deltaproteobacteria bacterium]|nr:ArsA family ATPase [Deltaproteobacteria bacterium]